MEDEMKNTTLVSRLALACALLLSLPALAGETTEIEVIAGGVTEKLSIEDLKVGETRQLYSEAGTLVTATRTAQALQLDIGGDKTTVPMVESGDLLDEEIEALIERHHGEAADGKRVVRIHRADGEHAKADGRHRKVIVVDAAEGSAHALDGDGPHVLVKDAAGGKQVIVKRKVTKADADAK
jgi:hypothetical protein